MLVRPLPAQRSLSLSRLNILRRPQLPSGNRYPQSFHTSRRFLTAQTELSPRRKKISQDTRGPVFQRSLATTISDPIRQDEIRFDHLQSSIPSHFSLPLSNSRLYDIKPFDPSAPLLVKVNNDDPIPRARINTHGIPGGVDEMLSIFDACLQVKNLDRAALVLTRFGDMGVMPGHELIVLHNRYLRAAIEKAFEQPDSEWAQSLHKWYEVHIRRKDIPQTSETIACMLKVSLISSQGSRLERLVNRYMDMLSEDAIYQVLEEEDILTQQDFGVIASIYQPASGLLENWEFSSEDEGTQLPVEQVDSSQAEPEPDTTPQVRPVPQKGLGLKSLRGVLSFFSEVEGQDLSKLSLAERREIQRRLEMDCVDAAINRWREENDNLKKMGLNSALSTNALNSQLYEWQCALESRLEKEFALFAESEQRERKSMEDQDRCLYAPFLRLSNPARLAAVTIIGVLNTLSTSGADGAVQLSFLLTQLSRAVEEDIRYILRNQQSTSQKPKSKKRANKPGVNQAQESSKDAPQSANIGSQSNVVESSAYEVKSWPVLIKTKIGVALLSALMDTAKVNVVREHPETKTLVSQNQPAMTHSTMHRKGKKIGVVMPNKFLVDLLKREPPAEFLARHLPMIVEPEPWTKFDKGGFLEYPAQLVRVKYGEKDQRVYTEAAVQKGDMEQVSKGLDVLGRTGWRINKPVFDVMLEAWNSGDEIANIPPLNPQIPLPEEPEPSDNPMQRREWLKAVKAVENEKSGLHSERCFMNFQLEIARAFKDQTFYFPHNMDFRGRAYPIPTYLNHMGADHVRGLLRFSKGKELGETGLRWLKIHLANVFGYDKASLKEREAFVTDNLDDIYDSANNPLTGRRWWLQAEDAWQCLAACFEVKAALESPDPTQYVSHLPVHQDGTCNGLQHYAALGGDSWGAQQVNLEPGDRPADVYSAVANLVKESVAEDLKADNFLAKAIDGKITRKVVKQTVMTNVYGVTYVGAKAQVSKQLDAAYPNLQKEAEVPVDVIAAYVATKIFQALSTMFRGAHDIQYWLGECAGRVCRAITPEQMDRIANGDALKSVTSSRSKKKTLKDQLLSQFRSTVVWTTPLRMPIVQPYRKSGTRTICTSLQDLTLQVPERSDPVNRRKQLQAFPPNFIHSLDASHMLLSALECDELGLTFAAVHDSFWTHASDIEVMNRVLRDCFIRIHSEDVVGRLAAEFEARYKGSIYMTKIKRGSPVEARIVEWRREKKLTLSSELLEERERQRLLVSSDPEEVEKGKKMVTPASIYEEMSSFQPVTSTTEMESVGLGNIPGTTTASEAEENDDNDLSEAASPGKNYHTNIEHVKSLLGVTLFESELTGVAGKKLKKKADPQTGINIWLPLTFPKVPEKGDFDVSRLKDSQYFFS
ncbi:DNA/RNA polymerase [Hypoxylon trugodes]|uniref:DNA/RNA polymerase n=1 Tax=Hypoxylon trugodes TaxID=326681 RepID=UPI0021979F62|nr:DNA/RNA polymerase [Hypoxylon trugodes]KAI1386405.1 DNA/RNA polymerase [Hypoxylon trugodes]